ncbi:YceI family protein, partial [Phenylobacterium sp.]|uniref:YceI family protein n=1 Tax=Phenylobacterium sp. TaxID=1871053 RepID=UPI002E355615
DTLRRWEKTLAGVTHAGFYLVMIGMPLSGWLMVSTSRIEIPTLLYGVIPWPDLPGSNALSRELREELHDVGEAGHDSIIKLFYGLIALHVAGALKHQLFSRDEPVLARMAPGARAGRRLEPRLAIIALAAAAVAAFAAVVTPPIESLRPPAAASADEDEPIEAAGPGEPLAAAPAAPGEPVAWRVDDGSKIEFETAWGETRIEGEFERFSAEMRFSPEALDRSRVSVTIDLASVDTGDAQRDGALPGFDFFNTAEHPRATFVADRFERTGQDSYIARGRLTLRGVTQPVNLPFELDLNEDRARVRGKAAIDRNAFGIGQGEFAATDQIPAQVKIEVDLRARR